MNASISGPRVVPLLNLKGGVGKTSTCLGLADALAARYADSGQRVLLIDMDPQANLTQVLAPDLAEDDLTINDVLASDTEGGAFSATRATNWAGVDLIPSEIALANRESDGGPTSYLRLRRSLRGLQDSDTYAVVLIDCNPAIGVLTVNALAAADFAVMVTEASRPSLKGVGETMNNVTKAAELREGLRVAGIICNKLDRRSGEENFRHRELREAYGNLVWEPTIPDRAAVKTAMGAAAPLSSYSDPAARDLAQLYTQLATRLMEA